MRRRLLWLADRPWWRWQSGIAAGIVLMGLASVGYAINGVIDTQADARNDRALTLELDRARYEQECRLDAQGPIDEIDSQVLDAIVALIQASAADNVNHEQEALASLDFLRGEKAEALGERAAAVDECRSRARELYGPR